MRFLYASLFITLFACQNTPPKKTVIPEKARATKTKIVAQQKQSITKKVEPLNDKTAIPFFYEYEKNNPETQIRIETQCGNIDIELDRKKPYHRANFVFLIKNNYFDGTLFHRVVPEFIIQGGASDNSRIMRKRRELGRYLIPVDAAPSDRHHRGVISMPSSEIDNPYKLASPYEFFIVQQRPGAYHLDGDYTPFGRVIKGMDVVDKINQVAIDKREMPLINISMKIKLLK